LSTNPPHSPPKFKKLFPHLEKKEMKKRKPLG